MLLLGLYSTRDGRMALRAGVGVANDSRPRIGRISRQTAVSLARLRSSGAPMVTDVKDLFDTEVWTPALEKYGAVTRLTVTLFDADCRRVGDPVPPTPLFDLFRRHGYEPEIVSDCACRCVEAKEIRPAAVVCQTYGLAVVGTALKLGTRTVGAAVAGFSLLKLPEVAAAESFARHAGIPFTEFWQMALHTQPSTERRLAMYGDLLRVIGETIVRESDRKGQLQSIASSLEQRVDERTQELAAANRALALELNQRTEAEARIRELVGRIVSVQEEERRRVARDAHDHLGQLIVALRLRLELLHPLDTEYQKHLQAAEALLRQLDDDLESLTQGLRPRILEELGLAAALASLVADWSCSHGIVGRFNSSGASSLRLTADAEINLFRIVQEALTNTSKHANATRADVSFRIGDGILALTIEDDGDGFDPAQITSRTGLIGMQERAALIDATLDVRTRPNRGTTVLVVLPLRGTAAVAG
jgi:signal transduction histidine kinase